MAMDVWNRIVARNIIPVDPLALSKFARRFDPLIYKQIEKITRKPIFKEMHYTRAFLQDNALNCPEIVEFLIARVYPNDIHIGDISIKNPYKPLPTNLQKCSIHTHKGFGLLSPLMDNIISYGRSKKCDYLTLVASQYENVELFERYGLSVEDNEFARLAMSHGQTIPMEMKL